MTCPPYRQLTTASVIPLGGIKLHGSRTGYRLNGPWWGEASHWQRLYESCERYEGAKPPMTQPIARTRRTNAVVSFFSDVSCPSPRPPRPAPPPCIREMF